LKVHTSEFSTPDSTWGAENIQEGLFLGAASLQGISVQKQRSRLAGRCSPFGSRVCLVSWQKKLEVC